MLPWPHRESHSDAISRPERNQLSSIGCWIPDEIVRIICIRRSQPVALNQQLPNRLCPATAGVPVVAKDIVMIPEHDGVARCHSTVVVADAWVIVAVTDADLIVRNQAMIEVASG